MPRKVLAVVGLFVALIIAGCASPTPEPTATPSPTPTAEPTPTHTPQPTATPTSPAWLGYAEEEGLEGEDAETYASAFADARALGLDDAGARHYANALVYLNGVAVAAAWDAFIAENVIGRFIEAFDEAVKTNGATASDAVSYAYAIALNGDGARAAAYSKAFAQTEFSGVASHFYAFYYVQELVRGATSPPDEYADFLASLAEANARGYTLSSASSVQERLAYAELYMSGYSDAILMAAHERGYTREWVARNWAEVIAGAGGEERAHIYALAYADALLAGLEGWDVRTYSTAYEEAYTSRKEQGATDEDAHLYAAAFADAKLGS